jgi:putative transposase
MRQTATEGVRGGTATTDTPEPMLNILQQIEVDVASGKTSPTACREAEVTEQTYYSRVTECCGVTLDRAERLTGLGLPSERLKRLVSELTLDEKILQDMPPGESAQPQAARCIRGAFYAVRSGRHAYPLTHHPRVCRTARRRRGTRRCAFF